MKRFTKAESFVGQNCLTPPKRFYAYLWGWAMKALPRENVIFTPRENVFAGDLSRKGSSTFGHLSQTLEKFPSFPKFPNFPPFSTYRLGFICRRHLPVFIDVAFALDTDGLQTAGLVTFVVTKVATAFLLSDHAALNTNTLVHGFQLHYRMLF